MSNEKNRIKLQIEGMSCPACEASIEDALGKIKGVDKVRASFSEGTVEYNEVNGPVNISKIKTVIEDQGYLVVEGKVSESGNSFSSSQFIGIGIIIFAVYIIIKNTIGFNAIPDISPSMGYFALFVVGVVTSLHCVAMCGGINISQCLKYPEGSGSAGKIKPSILYNSGRVISYTIIGGLAGALGSAVSFSGQTKGLVAIFSGVFMILMGLNLFGTFPWISKLIPRFPRFLKNKKVVASSGKGPLVVGLLNGLMPCGPLQAMQLYALGTGSFLVGASSMLFFSLGTVPVMFGLGLFSSLMSAKFNKKMMQVGAVLVMTLGFIMLSRGMAISGITLQSRIPANAPVKNVAVVTDGIQNIETKLTGRGYPVITVVKGVPVRWNLKADEADINGCNKTIIIPEFNIEKDLKPGDNIFEFTPTKSGVISYTCWMGMISSKINVVENASDLSAAAKDTSNQDANVTNDSSAGGGCSMGAPVATDYKVKKATIENGVQTITINVNRGGYDPAIIVMQKGIKTKIKYNVKELSGCNKLMYFSLDDMKLDFSKKQLETPYFTPKEDIAFSCGMGMLQGYIKVVPDLGKADAEKIRNELLGK